MAKRATAAAGDFSEGQAGASFDENATDSIMVDLRDVEERSFETLPRGKYNVLLEKCEYRLSNSSGKPMWNIQLHVKDGEHATRKIFTFLSFSEGALPGTKAHLRILKPELLENPFDPSDQELANSIVGWEGAVRLTIRDYEGEPRNNVQAWISQGGGEGGFVE